MLEPVLNLCSPESGVRGSPCPCKERRGVAVLQGCTAAPWGQSPLPGWGQGLSPALFLYFRSKCSRWHWKCS